MYVHDGDYRTAGTARYGITEAKWVQGWGGIPMGIVSGGQDGEYHRTLWSVESTDERPNVVSF